MRKLNIIEATGNRSQNLRNYLPREVRSSGLRFVGLLYYNMILLWDLTYGVCVCVCVCVRARARARVCVCVCVLMQYIILDLILY